MQKRNSRYNDQLHICGKCSRLFGYRECVQVKAREDMGHKVEVRMAATRCEADVQQTKAGSRPELVKTSRQD